MEKNNSKEAPEKHLMFNVCIMQGIMLVSYVKTFGSKDHASERGISREKSVLTLSSSVGLRVTCFTQQLLPDISWNTVLNLFGSLSAETSAQCYGDGTSVAGHRRTLSLLEHWVLLQENNFLHNLPPSAELERDASGIRASKQLRTDLHPLLFRQSSKYCTKSSNKIIRVRPENGTFISMRSVLNKTKQRQRLSS